MSSTESILTGQSRSVTEYRNFRSKILKFCANVYFSCQCLKENLAPKYAKIKIPEYSDTSANEDNSFRNHIC